MNKLFILFVPIMISTNTEGKESWTCKADIGYLYKDEIFFIDHDVTASEKAIMGEKARRKARKEIRACAKTKRLYHRFPISCTGVTQEDHRSLKSLAKDHGQHDDHFDRKTYIGRHFDYKIESRGCENS